MPYVTQHRLVPGDLMGANFFPKNSQGFLPVKPGTTRAQSSFSQDTYSWRTTSSKPRGSQEAEEEGLFESTSGSAGRFYKDLRASDRLSRDNGHEFWTRKYTTTNFTTYVAISGNRVGFFTPEYRGWMAASTLVSGSIFPNVTFPSDNDILVDGAKAINRTIPTRSEASLAVALGELRERLPQIPGTTVFQGGPIPKGSGDEYLNVQFGIKPLVNDIRKVAQGILDFNKNAKALRDSSGEIVRRKTALYRDVRTITGPLNTFSIEIAFGNSPSTAPNFNSDLYWPAGAVDNVMGAAYDTITRNCWFSGAWTYYLSEAHSFLGKIADYAEKADHLLGFKLDAETLWNLSPWTWLFDWFADAGTFVSNVQNLANDALVLKYGYIMHQTEAVRDVFTPIPALYPGLEISASSVHSQTKVIEKKRTQATPYGFGLNTAAFTGTQWAILGALGLTKGPTSLRRDS